MKRCGKWKARDVTRARRGQDRHRCVCRRPLPFSSGLPRVEKEFLLRVVDRILNVERERALVALLDDDSSAVRHGVLAELKRLDDVGVSLLKKVLREGPENLSGVARELLDQLDGSDSVGEFIAFIRSLRYELESGTLLLNRVVKPDLDVAAACGQLDAIARRCEELMPKPGSTFEQCKVLNRVIFHEYGFRGNTEDFEDPLNSFLAPLLRRRKGIPISLSVLYILVARRCGLELEPVSLPHRFMVGCFGEGAPFYIDVFERGRFRSVDDIHALLEANHVPEPHRHIGPAAVGEVLCRTCRNLAHHFARKNNPRMSRLFAGFVREFDMAYRRHVKP